MPPALHLEPLGLHHAPAYWRALQVDAVRTPVRLELHGDAGQTRTWITRQLGVPGATLLAVMDGQHQLIGACGYDRRGAAALFYYWIAGAHWGRGHGGAALHLLQEHARRQGIERLYSSVFAGNHRSLHLLRKAGFHALRNVAEAAEAADGDLPCYACDLRGGAMPPPHRMRQELARLMAAAGSALLIVPDQEHCPS